MLRRSSWKRKRKKGDKKEVDKMSGYGTFWTVSELLYRIIQEQACHKSSDERTCTTYENIKS